MIHFDEALGTFTLIIKGAKITFPTIGSMIKFAKKQYGINLLETLN